MYLLTGLSDFTLNAFERGLQGLTEEEARIRPDKAGGEQMNAISWITGHVCCQWTSRATVPRSLRRQADGQSGMAAGTVGDCSLSPGRPGGGSRS